MGYIKNNNGQLEIISCKKEIAEKLKLIEEPNDFKISQYGKYNAEYYNSDYTLKTEEQLIKDKLIVDNKGIYYYTENAQKIEITEYNIDKPDGVTELEPCEFPKWDGKKWTKDKDKEKVCNLSVAKNELKSLDIEVSRPLEDIYEVLTDEQKEAINQDTKDKISDKKIKREIYLKLLK